jgi:allantoinase
MQVHVGLYGGLVPDNMEELPGLLQTGILGIKCFLSPSGIEEFPNVSGADLDAAMPLIAEAGIPLLAHCEIVDGTDFQPNDSTSYKEYMQSRPSIWELNAIKLLLEKSAKYDCPVHIVHVSSAESLELIVQAKQQGLKVTAETCPHYLLFDAEHIPDGNPLFKCAPPIRSRENNDGLINGLRSGILDFISSDHSPAPPDIKRLDTGHIAEAWGGIAGLQFLLNGSWSAVSKHIGLESFIPLLTSEPAKFLQIQDRKGCLEAGYDADIVIWDPEITQDAGSIANFHRHAPSPYHMLELQGKIIQTYVAGQLVFDNNQIVHKNSGQWVLRK